MTDEEPLRVAIFEELRSYAVSNIPKKISNIVELLKLAGNGGDFVPQADRIHLANGTLMLDGRFIPGKSEVVRARFPVSYNPDAPQPDTWLTKLISWLSGL